MRLCERLATLRGQQGLTQGELAQKVGVTRQAVSKWERGVIAPSTVNLIALGRLYGVPLDELVNGEPQSEEPPAAAVAVAEKPEAAEPRRKPGLLRLAGAVVLAGCILLSVIASTIIICSAGFREPEKSKIIRMEDMEGEEIDLSEVENVPDVMKPIDEQTLKEGE